MALGVYYYFAGSWRSEIWSTREIALLRNIRPLVFHYYYHLPSDDQSISIPISNATDRPELQVVGYGMRANLRTNNPA